MTTTVACPACGRVTGVYKNGRVRPHYPPGEGRLCPGAFTIPADSALEPIAAGEAWMFLERGTIAPEAFARAAARAASL